jgi:hypothetical protein
MGRIINVTSTSFTKQKMKPELLALGLAKTFIDSGQRDKFFEMKIRLFIKPYCPWCHKAMRRLDERLKIAPSSVTR